MLRALPFKAVFFSPFLSLSGLYLWKPQSDHRYQIRIFSNTFRAIESPGGGYLSTCYHKTHKTLCGSFFVQAVLLSLAITLLRFNSREAV